VEVGSSVGAFLSEEGGIKKSFWGRRGKTRKKREASCKEPKNKFRGKGSMEKEFCSKTAWSHQQVRRRRRRKTVNEERENKRGKLKKGELFVKRH